MKYIITLSEYLKETKSIEELSDNWNIDEDIKDIIIEKVKILSKVFFDSKIEKNIFINVEGSTHIEDRIEMIDSKFEIFIESEYNFEDEKSYGLININGKHFSLITHSHDQMGGFDSEFFEKEILEIKEKYEILSNVKYTNDKTPHNIIYPLIKTFIKNDNFKELISEFFHYRIIENGVLYKDRFEMFMDDFGLEMPNMEWIEKYYKIV